MQKQGEATAPELSLRRLATDHLSTTLALASATAVLVRSLAISRYDEDTTLAVLSSSDLGGLIIGSVAILLPLAAPLAIVYVDLTRVRSPGGGNPLIWGPAQGVLGLFVLTLTPTSVIVATVLGGLIGAVLFRLVKRLIGRTARSDANAAETRRLVLGVLIAFNATFLLTYSVPWLPPERITSGDTTSVGYVLGSSAGWTSILTEPGRRVLRVRDADVVGRVVCQLPSPNPPWGDSPAVLLRHLAGSSDQGVPCLTP